jgi:predicted dehydrogenase
MPRNIVLAGLGPHARHNYYPVLERLREAAPVNLKLVIDLKDQQETVMRFLRGRSVQPEDMLFLVPSYRVSEAVPPEAGQLLERIHRQDPIDRLIVSTEPKSHKGYIIWALEHGIDVMTDKPITAPIMQRQEESRAWRIFEDYLEIEQAQHRSGSRAVVMTHRRHHPGFTFVREYLQRFLKEFGVPITFIEVFHADGMWKMPDEFYWRENHPYKYGYGKLMHSGYHQIDMFMWLAELNQELPGKEPDALGVTTCHVTPTDFLHQVDATNYRRLFGTKELDPYFDPAVLETTSTLGETDVFVLAQLRRGHRVMTTGAINMLQTSFSQRAWTKLPEDMFNKSNGRVRHERLTIQVGHLLNVQIHSYKTPQDKESGAEERFTIVLMRNAALVGGPAYEEITLPKESVGRPESLHRLARQEMMLQWLEGGPTNSPLISHRNSVKLLATVYKAMFRQNHGQAPVASMTLDGPRRNRSYQGKEHRKPRGLGH